MLIDEVTFDSDVFLLSKTAAKRAKAGPAPALPVERRDDGVDPNEVTDHPTDGEVAAGDTATSLDRDTSSTSGAPETTLRLAGTVPPEIWNRIGIKLIPKLRSATELTVSINIAAKYPSNQAGNFATELRRILDELGIGTTVRVE